MEMPEHLVPRISILCNNVYDNADEIEVSYDCLKKYLAGEIEMDDVDFSTHKL